MDYISGIRKELLGIEDNAKNINGLTAPQWVAIRAAHRLLGEYIKEKVEWSEEEETIIDCAVEVVEKAGLPSLAASLESLRPRPKQEWSDEDELLRKRCIADLGYLTEYEPQYKERYDTQIDWLKSLHPHLSDEEIKKIRSEEYTKGFNDAAFGGKAWKPSEEQLKALKGAQLLYEHGLEREDISAVLKSLHDDLIKL